MLKVTEVKKEIEEDSNSGSGKLNFLAKEAHGAMT